MINYYLLTKPGIILGNLITVAAGFALGSRGHFDLLLFLATMLGLGLIIASACVFNNYIDRTIDMQMERTKNRALARGAIAKSSALLFASTLGIAGALLLFFLTNLLALTVAGVGFFVYVLLYSIWKRRTVYATAIGSIAGAIPPVVGYCAASNQFDAAAAIFFLMMVLWQMPHFFAIALMHLEDYKRAQVPVLPIFKGVFRTKVHMLLYILAFIPISMLLTLFGYTGYLFLVVIACLGGSWLLLALKGFGCQNDQRWGRQMFYLSLLLIGGFCVTITFS